MRASVSVVATCLLSACSLFQSAPASAPETPPLAARIEREVTTDEANLHVAEFVRNTPGSVQVSLWVDAGWLDAPNPDVAVASALYAARMEGATVSIRVTPHATSFETLCDAPETLSCAVDLLQRLAIRADDPDQWARISPEIIAHMQPSTPPITADAALMRLLSGSDQEETVTEPTPVGLESVHAFQTAHYGPSRAAIFLVGDVPEELNRNRLREVILQLPEATQPASAAASLGGPPLASSVIEGSEGWLSLAAVAPSYRAAENTARFLRRSGSYPGLHANAFRLRNASIVKLSGPLDRVTADALWTRFALQMRREMSIAWVAPGRQELSPSGLLAFSQWQGETWVHARHGRDGAEPHGSMVAVVVAPADGRRAARRLRQTRERMNEATLILRPSTDLELSSMEHPRLWSAQSDAGAKVWFQQRSGAPRATVLIAFRGGAGADPPSEHGRAALFAYTLAERCRQLAPPQSEIRPVVSPSHAGLAISTRSEEHLTALRWAQRCAFDLTITGDALQRARIRLMQDQTTAARRFEAAAALNLSPARPGIIAPLGSRGRLSSVRTDRLRAVAARDRVRSRLRVAIVGDFSLEEVQSSLGPMLDGLSQEGETIRYPDWSRGPSELFHRAGNDLGGSCSPGD